MKLLAQFHESLPALIADQAATVEIAWADGSAPVTFVVNSSGGATAAATALVAGFDALPSAQRKSQGVGVRLVAIGSAVVLIGATTDALSNVALIGKVDGGTTNSPVSSNHVLMADYTTPPAAGYTVGQVAAVAAAVAVLARSGS